MASPVFSPDAQWIAKNYLARTGRPQSVPTPDILRPPFQNPLVPSIEDSIQYPVDQYYREGINFTPPVEQQPQGMMNWLDRVANILTGATVMRGAPPGGGSMGRSARRLLPGLGNDPGDISPGGAFGSAPMMEEVLRSDEALGVMNPVRRQAPRGGVPVPPDHGEGAAQQAQQSLAQRLAALKAQQEQMGITPPGAASGSNAERLREQYRQARLEQEGTTAPREFDPTRSGASGGQYEMTRAQQDQVRGGGEESVPRRVPSRGRAQDQSRADTTSARIRREIADEGYEYVPLTREQATQLGHGDEVWYSRNDPGSAGGPGFWARFRVSGQPQTWVRTPGRFRVPVRHGLYTNSAIEPDSLGRFYVRRPVEPGGVPGVRDAEGGYINQGASGRRVPPGEARQIEQQFESATTRPFRAGDMTAEGHVLTEADIRNRRIVGSTTDVEQLQFQQDPPGRHPAEQSVGARARQMEETAQRAVQRRNVRPPGTSELNRDQERSRVRDMVIGDVLGRARNGIIDITSLIDEMGLSARHAGMVADTAQRYGWLSERAIDQLIEFLPRRAVVPDALDYPTRAMGPSGTSVGLRDAQTLYSRMGVTLSRRAGEYRVNFRGGSEDTAYYTNDLRDAMDTARAMIVDRREIERATRNRPPEGQRSP